ncbi:hypothetical protein [Ralstonia solanacearum]|uniref:hypothetical protein n=1 Tax=Ralstonia solanacearum TaxID=305 RepID=UPI0018D001A7|nr:hypothetical protein [Ralstonia solanacearum]
MAATDPEPSTTSADCRRASRHSQGFTVGTWLGGLGKKFAFVAYLQQADAAGVITALKTEQSL